ncbi:hypothetical protein LA76x_1317 [Lysobacter antibioticus]|uniref:Uncharacterized protein n=2 Tax=Lysobacter antibioticus TaxID=84531 RepID=A0A0S2F7G8_LYSAN|nr:hypothetical protein LA76x_1317 [Lysobacter antibioticus]
MSPHEDGGYIDRDDANSLAGALLGLLAATKRRVEDAEAALAQRDSAVAELVEADREYDEALCLANIGYGSDHEDRAAQQRLREAITRRRDAVARFGAAP